MILMISFLDMLELLAAIFNNIYDAKLIYKWPEETQKQRNSNTKLH